MELTKEHFEKFLKDQLDPIRTDVGSLKTDVGTLKTNVDLLTIGHESLTVQINSIALDLADVKETVERIDKRDIDDSNLLSRSFVDHDNRLRVIEKRLDIKKLKTA